jgi:hypothetical protein
MTFKMQFLAQIKYTASALTTNRLMILGKQSLFILRITRSTQIHSVNKMQGFEIINHAIRMQQPSFKGLKTDRSVG